MYCRNCGNELPEGANFCPACGTGNEVVIENRDAAPANEAPVYEANPTANEFPAYDGAVEPSVNEPTEPALSEEELIEKNALAGKILTFGILGLAFSEIGLLGLIFSIIAKAKVKAFTQKFGETTGRASVGKGLSIGGFITSIIMTCFWGFYTLIVVLALLIEML
jgi:hypothetical protein